MVGSMDKSEFKPTENYDHFYTHHKFEPFPEEYALDAHKVLPRAEWALDVAKDNNYKSLIDLCCLDGYVALTLSNHNDMKVVGIDLSQPGIDLANKRADKHKLDASFLQMSGEEYSTKDKFDMVTMFEAVEHFTDTPGVLKQYISYLSPGGSLLISTPDAEGFYGIGNDDACHLRYYSHKTKAQMKKSRIVEEWEGRPILSLPDLIEELGGVVQENEVWNELCHLRATFK